MEPIRSLLGLALAASTAAALPDAARAQDAIALDAQARARFRQLDGNEDGWLSGRELDACRCRAADRDGNGKVTWPEYYRSELQAAVAQLERAAGLTPAGEATRPASGTTPPSAFRPGDRVTADFGGVWYPGVVEAERDGRYNVSRDGYGPNGEWLEASALRALPRQAAAQPQPAAEAPTAAPSRFRLGERVEVHENGTWYPGTVASVRNDRYGVLRDDHAYGVASGESVGGDRLRPLAARPAPPPTAVAGLPASVPTGRYVCTTYATYATTVGVIRVVGNGVYTGMNAQGTGPQQRFSYDPGTGAIQWGGGRIPGLAWPVRASRYMTDTKGQGTLVVHYQLREGGNVNSMSCSREGA